MNSKIVGVTAILATFVILAYAVFAVSANEQACEHSQAYGDDGSASDTGKTSASDNSVLKRCMQPCPVPGIIDAGGSCVCPPGLSGTPPVCGPTPA